MKAYDIDLEMRMLRSSVSSPKRLNIVKNLGGTSLFNYDAAKEIFKRANKIVSKTGQAPTWKELTHDTRLPESVRELMPEIKKPIKKLPEFQRGANQLVDYARIRVGVDAARDISDLMKDESVDPDEITEILAKSANSSRKVVQDDIFRHFGLQGKGNRSGKDALKTLMKMGTQSFIPTGLKAFDERSRGFFKPSLVVIASQSGGGKSKLAGQLRLNMSKMGFRSIIWSLEMDHDEMEMRLLAQLTQIPMERFLFPEKLTKKDRKKIVSSYDAYQKHLIKIGGHSTLAVPTGEVDIRSLLEQSEPFDYDCVIIDYLSLLEDSSAEQQWKALSEAARIAKRWSASTNTTVILLAQLKEDENLKQAKYVKDHANNMMTWKFGEREQETRILHIRQQKARNQPMYDFYLKDDTDTMTIRDCTEEELEEYMRTQKRGNKGSMSDYEKIKNRR